jgi:hypothetical protein
MGTFLSDYKRKAGDKPDSSKDKEVALKTETVCRKKLNSPEQGPF